VPDPGADRPVVVDPLPLVLVEKVEVELLPGLRVDTVHELHQERRMLAGALQAQRAYGKLVLNVLVEVNRGDGRHVPLRYRAGPPTPLVERTAHSLTAGLSTRHGPWRQI
jgi:hypothetical protein